MDSVAACVWRCQWVAQSGTKAAVRCVQLLAVAPYWPTVRNVSRVTGIGLGRVKLRHIQ